MGAASRRPTIKKREKLLKMTSVYPVLGNSFVCGANRLPMKSLHIQGRVTKIWHRVSKSVTQVEDVDDVTYPGKKKNVP